ncbi:30S ribosomal protein S16 [Haematomicrobium sanguinis]|uniref:30S ribosomal protein S16 n=1 Tax=Haematomicrobium sanguinis TaxID=479106 RepID=UPI000478C242|nr:30S ribosomal protein S16 [Haematomicrobium sanguinis]
MAVKIRLKRFGKIRAPYYRIVVMDSRAKRDGRAIEEIGKYHPTENPSFIEVKSDRAQYWLGVGAQPTEQVLNILKITGDWQKFKGLPGAEGTLKTKEAKEEFVAPEKDSVILPEAITKKGKAEEEAEEIVAEAEEPAADAAGAEAHDEAIAAGEAETEAEKAE